MPDLPPPISTYFDTPPDADVAKLGAIFAADARVHDEARDYSGLAEIRTWRVDTHAKTPFVVRPLTFREQDDALVVTAEVSGAFPGSPVTLNHVFVLDVGRIAALRIG